MALSAGNTAPSATRPLGMHGRGRATVCQPGILHRKGKVLKQLLSDQPVTPPTLWLKLAAPQFSGANLLLGSGSEKGWYMPQRL